ncbi:MAG: response regulator transcription factor [Nitrospira sp.]
MTGLQGSILMFIHSEPFAQSLKKVFVASGYRVACVATETAALAALKESLPSLIIVERQDGIAPLLRQLRSAANVPIVALVNESDSCQGDEWLQDYDQDIDLVLCNQTPRQVVARVRAILRRCISTIQPPKHFRAGTIGMDIDRHEVTVDGRVVELTPKEFQILHQFIEAPGRVFSRQEMLNRVWGEGYALEEHALDVHIHSLRQKVEIDPNEPRFIMTVRGIGYKLRV